MNAPPKNATTSLIYYEEKGIESKNDHPHDGIYDKIKGQPLIRMINKCKGMLAFQIEKL